MEVDSRHSKLKAENNFVWDNYSAGKPLLYAVPALRGKVKVPEGIETLNTDCFMESDITQLIFPDTLTQFNESAIIPLKRLGVITFGASRSLQGIGGGAKYIQLSRVIFNDATETLDFAKTNFSGETT